MPKQYYCWRCKSEMPMLSEDEWREIAPLLSSSSQAVKDYRRKHNVGLREALRQGFEKPALDKYKELTGFTETNVNAIYHHRISIYGPECSKCGKLLRTDRARFCAECGHMTGK